MEQDDLLKENQKLRKQLKTAKNKYVAEARGYIIHHCILIEENINTIMKTYFCEGNETKQKEFLHLMLSKEGFSLNQKKEILYYLITNLFLKEFEAYLKIADFKKHFEALLEIRNHCAHRLFYTDESTVLENVALQHYKTKDHSPKVDKIAFAPEDLQKFGASMMVVSSGVAVVLKLMGIKVKA